MRQILKPREILDRRALAATLDKIAEDDLSDTERRAHLIDTLKGTLRAADDEIRRRLDGGKHTGNDCVAARSYMMDQLIRVLFDYALNHLLRRGAPTTGERISVMAIGGYGRGELAPLSDIDLLFLLPYKETPFTEQLVEFILYTLWDLGLKVGQSVRSIDENISHAKADITVRTSLLDARWIWGDQELADEFVKRFKKDIIKGSGAQFVQAKLAERDARHDKTGNSSYRLEPNIKDDKGGQRDLHTLYWIAKYLYGVSDVRRLADMGIIDDDAAMRFLKAQDFLNTVRCYLHYLSGRTDNRLTFDLQREIAKRMNYSDRAGSTATERFMKHYFLIARDVGDLTRIFIAKLEEKGRRKPLLRLPAALRRRKIEGFVSHGGRISLTEDELLKTPLKLLQIFRVVQKYKLDFQPDALRVIALHAKRASALRNNAEANRIFMEILTDEDGAENILRLMSEAGVFGRFIPDFARVVAQMQYDMYHVYTTDEHTIRAVGILNRIEQGKLKDELPIASDVIHKVQSRRALYVAVMLHDIAKGRGGDHSELGADIALELCPRLGLTPEETESVSWLVRHHLLMSSTAFKRDLDDAQTIIRFAEAVQSPERLRLLLVLTCADIRAVGPNVWNNWKATLLRELYHRAEEQMSGAQNTATRDARVAASRAALVARLTDWPEEARESFAASAPPAYWLTYDTDAQERHARFIRAAEAKNEKVAITFAIELKRDATAMTVYTPDHPGLFAKIAGALALSGVSIVDAKILTFANGMALDTFYFQDYDGEMMAAQDGRLDRIKKRVVVALEGRIRLHQELERTVILRVPTRAKAMEVPPRVFIDNTASKVCTVIEINGHDRPGFLYDVTKTLTDLGLQIASAHISTYGERVVDVFYVKDIFGMKVENDTKLRQIRDALGKTIGVAATDVSVQVLQKREPQPAATAAE